MKRIPRSRAFTLIELMIVIGVIALLIGLLMPAIQRSRQKAHIARCTNNLRQFATALFMYRESNDDMNPGWLSNMYPESIPNPDMYVCYADRTAGRAGSKPEDLHEEMGPVEWDFQQFRETDDNDSHPPPYHGRNGDIHACSYLYEFCAAPCSWLVRGPGYLGLTDPNVLDTDTNGVVSWGEAKTYQLARGDMSTASGMKPYSTLAFPIVRCFHHYKYREVPAYDPSDLQLPPAERRIERKGMTLNVAYAGNVFMAPLQWETFTGSHY
jgi:prepilin-type N-terminal cleavage/methylation domain-containing protein